MQSPWRRSCTRRPPARRVAAPRRRAGRPRGRWLDARLSGGPPVGVPSPNGSGGGGPVRPTPRRAPRRAVPPARGHVPVRVHDRRERRSARRRPEERSPRRRPGRAEPRGLAVHAPSRRRRAVASARRRRARFEHGRTQGDVQRTPRTAARATRQERRSARTRGERSGSATRGRNRRPTAPGRHSMRTATEARARTTPCSHGRGQPVPGSCRLRVRFVTDRQPSSTTEAASISRRAGRAASKSSSSLIGKKRPRGPDRGTSRNVVSSSQAIW